MTPAPFDASGLPQQGDLIAGKYLVEEVLGQGGMGVVVAARHIALRQRVAVKFLLPAGLRLPGARERFLREAQAAAALQSEHVARVLDVGTLETGAPYLVMEYLSGTDLSCLLKSRGSLPIVEAVDLVLQACEAIGEAHALGIVHRDLKPQNLFVVMRGGARFIKVLDFGLSKMPPTASNGPEVSLTATDLVVGSPQYMSPEHIRSLKHVDARSDIWALGVILYQLVTGRRPFLGDSMIAICASIAADTPRPPSTYRRDVPASLDALVQHCLEKDPARRIQTVAELVQGLSPFTWARTGSPAERRDPSFTSAPALPSHASIPAIDVSVPGSPTGSDRTTARLSTWGHTQPRPRSQRFALLFATGAVMVAVAGLLAIGVTLVLQRDRGEVGIEMTAPVSPSPAVAAPGPPPVEEKPAVPIPTESVTVAPPAPAARAPHVVPASTALSLPRPDARVAAAASAEAASPPSNFDISNSDIKNPWPEVTAEVSVKAMPPPPPATAAPAATVKPDAGQAPKPKTTKDLMERYE
jgi:eukaryotic-like serine/threonine-protein kinase